MPEACAGLTAVMEVSELTVKEVAATEPNITEEAPVKPLPLMATEVPPPVLPDVVPSDVTDGADAAV
jgi:hypothetical protein